MKYEVLIHEYCCRWFKNEQLYRLYGSCCEFADGSRAWYQNSKCHREDGTAIERKNGEKRWYINGIEYTEEKFKKRIQSGKK